MTAKVRPDAVPELRGARVVVVGAAKSGLSLARFLVGAGARVTLTDARPATELAPEVGGVAALGATLELGGHRDETLLSADLIAVSPGVPLSIAPLSLLDVVLPHPSAPNTKTNKQHALMVPPQFFFITCTDRRCTSRLARTSRSREPCCSHPTPCRTPS